MKHMTDPTAADWKRLGDRLIHRRTSLGYRTRASFAAEKGFKNDRVIAAIENAERTNFSPGTIASFEVAYELHAGAIGVALAGGELMEINSAEPEGVTASDLDARLNNLDRQVNALWSAIGSLPSATADEIIRKLGAKPGDDELLQKLGMTDELERRRAKADLAFGAPEGGLGIEGPVPADDLAADFEEGGTEYQRRHDAEHGDDNEGR